MRQATTLATTVVVIGTLLATGALADDNFSKLLQNGATNSALVDQSSGSDNRVGTAALAARQVGNDNILEFTQSGDGNEIGSVGFLQQSNRNTATILQASDGNAVIEVLQKGIASGFGAHRRNTLTIVQEGGDGNVVQRVEQIRVGGLLALPGQQGNVASIVQNGAGNTVTLLSQNGLRNTADLNFKGNANMASAVQEGAENTAAVTVIGDDNRLSLHQVGAGNAATLSVQGYSNNAGAFSPGAHGALADLAGLAPGDIVQVGLLNSIDYNLGSADPLSSGNSFAFSQNGVSNQIVGETDGSGNQVVVVQEGTLNLTSFVQLGNFNTIGVSQR